VHPDTQQDQAGQNAQSQPHAAPIQRNVRRASLDERHGRIEMRVAESI
jgi:hypothetical protein